MLTERLKAIFPSSLRRADVKVPTCHSEKVSLSKIAAIKFIDEQKQADDRKLGISTHHTRPDSMSFKPSD